MAQFKGTLLGNRGETSRLGSKKSGLLADVNGWNVGVRVHAYYDERTGMDKISVDLTGGSNNRSPRLHIGTFDIDTLKNQGGWMYETINIIFCISFVASLYVSWILKDYEKQGQLWVSLMLILSFLNPFPLLIAAGAWLCLYYQTHKANFISIAIFFVIVSFYFKETYY